MLQKSIHILPLFFLLSLFFPNNADCKDGIEEILKETPDSTYLHVVVLMKERPDQDKLEELVRYLPKNERKAKVWEELVDLASSSQSSVRKFLGKRDNLSRIAKLKTLYIANGFVLEAKKDVIEALLKRKDIKSILGGNAVEPGDSKPRTKKNQAARLDDISWSVEHIGAPEVWQSGITGEGILVAIIDTGVNYNHNDINDHLWDGGEEFPHHGYDFHDSDDDPMDFEGHGTSVAGIIAGDGTSGDTTGVALDATIMCLKVRHDLYTGRVSSAWLAQDFALEHGADIIAMSLGWGSPADGDRQTWRNIYEILNIAGIVCTKSGGNRRETHSVPESISVPGRVPSPWRHPDETGIGGRGGLITVGAVIQNNQVEAFSSPGPVTWQEIEPWNDYPIDSVNTGMIKPDICAPGINGHSLNYSTVDGYSTFSHTSMAQPHVAGVAALMLSKNPELLPVHVDSILQTTAIDLGQHGKDNDYGAGLVQAVAAVNAVPDPMGIDIGGRNATTLPEELALVSVHPNPFNSRTTLKLELKRDAYVRVQVFNLIGQQVAKILDGVSSEGKYSYPVDGSNWSNGLYILRVQVDKRHECQKMLLLK